MFQLHAIHGTYLCHCGLTHRILDILEQFLLTTYIKSSSNLQAGKVLKNGMQRVSTTSSYSTNLLDFLTTSYNLALCWKQYTIFSNMYVMFNLWFVFLLLKLLLQCNLQSLGGTNSFLGTINWDSSIFGYMYEFWIKPTANMTYLHCKTT